MPETSVCQHLKQNFFTKGRTGMTSCFKGRFKVTSIRGYRTIGGSKEYHGGLDLVALDDKNVYAIADGNVDAAPYEPNGFGYYVRQLLPDGRRIYYGHMAKGSVAVKKGDRIKKGDKLGTMGSTGRSTGAHTHLEIRPKGTSKTSLDISEFTGIPNKSGTYTSGNIYSYDDTVETMLNDGVITKENMVNWELMLAGKADIKPEFFKKIVERYHGKN